MEEVHFFLGAAESLPEDTGAGPPRFTGETVKP
jgi:hypothetical protein